MRREPHTPREDLADGPLGLAEHAEGNTDHGRADKEGQQRICGGNVPDNADTRGDSGACGSEQAGDGDGTSFNNTSLTKEDCCQALTRWLRELDLNQRFQGESLAN